jgi:mRNA interferase RelE/StbE
MYTITFKESALKELSALQKPVVKKIAAAIDKLAINPRPSGVKKLSGGNENLYRIRVGDYRVIYVIEDVIRVVNMRKIGHRKDIYR